MERNQAIDIAKGLGILLVFLGHLPLPYWLINTRYFFHMPLFVALSGYFSKKQDIRNTLKKSTVKIALPYFFYGFVFCCINYLLFKNIGTKEIIGFLVARPMDIWQINFFGVFWFMIALFVIKMLAAIIPSKSIYWALPILFFFTIPFVVNRFDFVKNLPVAFAQGCILFIFYRLGAYLPKIKPSQNTIFFIISTLTLIGLAIFFIIKFDGMHQKITNYHNLKLFNPIGALFIAIAGIISTFTFSSILNNKMISKPLAKLGEYSFTFYALHLFVFFLVERTIEGLHFPSIVKLIVILTGTILLISFFIIIVKKMFQKNSFLQHLILLK